MMSVAKQLKRPCSQDSTFVVRKWLLLLLLLACFLFAIPSKTGEHHGEAFDRNPKTGDNKGYAQYAFEKAFGHNMGERQASSNGEFPQDPFMS